MAKAVKPGQRVRKTITVSKDRADDGQGRRRNLGLAIARGGWIQCDDDDWLYPHSI